MSADDILNATFENAEQDIVFYSPCITPATSTKPPKKGRPTTAENHRKNSANMPKINPDFFLKRKLDAEFDLEAQTARRSKMTPRSPVDSPTAHTVEARSHIPSATSVTHVISEPSQDNSTRNDLLLSFMKQLRATQAADSEKITSLCNLVETSNGFIKSMDAELKNIREELNSTKAQWNEKLSALEAKLSTLQNDHSTVSESVAIFHEDCAEKFASYEKRVNLLERTRSNSVSGTDPHLHEDLEKQALLMRAKNIVIRGFDSSTSSNPLESQVASCLQKYFGYKGTCTIMQQRMDGIVVTLETIEAKYHIFNRKRQALQGTGIFINSDPTPREGRISKKLRDIAKDDRAKGLPVKLAHLKIFRNDKWWSWDEAQNCLVQVQRDRRNSGPSIPTIASANPAPSTSTSSSDTYNVQHPLFRPVPVAASTATSSHSTNAENE